MTLLHKEIFNGFFKCRIIRSNHGRVKRTRPTGYICYGNVITLAITPVSINGNATHVILFIVMPCLILHKMAILFSAKLCAAEIFLYVSPQTLSE